MSYVTTSFHNIFLLDSTSIKTDRRSKYDIQTKAVTEAERLHLHINVVGYI